MTWREGLAAPGSGDPQHLHRLLLRYDYLARIPDQTVVVGDPGFREDRLLVTRGRDYLLAYRATGRPYRLRAGALDGERVRVRWMDPQTGDLTDSGTVANEGVLDLAPPVSPSGAVDTVLVLESCSTAD